MEVFVPKNSKSKFATCLYDIGRMMSNTGKSNIKYSAVPCMHTFQADQTYYNLDINTGKVTQEQGATVAATKFTLNSPIENDSWKLMAIFTADGNLVRAFCPTKEIPSRYFNVHLTCEHCHKNLYRKQLWLCQSKKDQDALVDLQGNTVHVAAGEFRMVGSSCIEIYTGFKANLLNKIRQLIDEAEALGQTSLDLFDVQKATTTVKLSKDDVAALAATFVPANDDLDDIAHDISKVMQLRIPSATPYDEDLVGMAFPIDPLARKEVADIKTYFADPNNGKRLIKNKPKFDEALKNWNYVSDSTAEVSTYYIKYIVDAVAFYENERDNVLGYTAEEKALLNFSSHAGDPLPVGTSLDVKVPDIFAYIASNLFLLSSGDVIRLNGGYYNKQLKKFISDTDKSSHDTITINIINSKTQDFRLTSFDIIEENTFSSANSVRLNRYECNVTAFDGVPFKAPVEPNNEFFDKANEGDKITRDIDHAQVTGNGWSEIIDSEGYRFAIYGTVPTDAKSFTAVLGKHAAFKGINKVTLRQVKFSDKTAADLAKEAPATPSNTATAADEYLGEIDDEVVIDVKDIDLKEDIPASFGKFDSYIIEDTLGHIIKVNTTTKNLIPTTAKLVKGKISKLDNYHGKKSTVLSAKSIEILK